MPELFTNPYGARPIGARIFNKVGDSEMNVMSIEQESIAKTLIGYEHLEMSWDQAKNLALTLNESARKRIREIFKELSDAVDAEYRLLPEDYEGNVYERPNIITANRNAELKLSAFIDSLQTRTH